MYKLDKYFRKLGGFDCRWEHLNMNTHDLAFRAQRDGSKFHFSPNLVLTCDWNPNEGDHIPVQAAYHANDAPLFQQVYREDQIATESLLIITIGPRVQRDGPGDSEMTNKTILVTGANGLVGSAIKNLEESYSQYNFVYSGHKDHELTNEQDVKALFESTKPDYVIHTAARVGGIGRNLSTPADQYYCNILMNSFVIHYAHLHNVEKLLAFSSVCAFPAGAESLHENILHDGEPYPAHYSYAYSKRMVDVQIGAYKKQHNVNYCSVIPGNIFGENDNFNLDDGHVVPSLIHKCYLAKQEGNH